MNASAHISNDASLDFLCAHPQTSSLLMPPQGFDWAHCDPAEECDAPEMSLILNPSLLEVLFFCHDVAIELLNCSEAFEVRVNYVPNEGHRLSCGPYADILVQCINHANAIGSLERLSLAPEVALFVHHFKIFRGLILDMTRVGTDALQREAFMRFNQTIQAFLLESQSPAFRMRMSIYLKAFQDNRVSLLRYFRSLFDRYARLLVIRLDLSYTEEEVQRQRYVHCGASGQYAFTPFDILQHRKRFFDYVQRSFGPSMRGFAWKLEVGRQRGYHYHTVIFLDGNQHCSDVRIAKSLGEHWSEIITQGAGTYFNCNAKSHDKTMSPYYYDATGMIHTSDFNAMEGLKKLADYITKVDNHMRAAIPPRARTFGRGQIRSEDARVRSGRPRQQQHASALWDVLGSSD
jgi:hypothetical protein